MVGRRGRVKYRNMYERPEGLFITGHGRTLEPGSCHFPQPPTGDDNDFCGSVLSQLETHFPEFPPQVRDPKQEA